MNKIKLKPCPLCGGEAKFMTEKGYYCLCDVLRVCCSDCKASTRFFKADVHYCAAEEAAANWNRRVNDETD